MKKLTTLLIFCLIVTLSFVLSGCNKWHQDKDISDELRDMHEEILENSLETLEENPDDITAKFEVAFRYQALGNYEKAKEYYELCLEYDANHIVALNNLADMLEGIEEYELAAEYIKRLYQIQPDSYETIKDTVRILLKAGDPDNAQLALENYRELMKDEEGLLTPEENSFISDLYDNIFEYSQSTQ